MKGAMKFIRNTLAVVGAFMIYGAVGTSDFYVMELNQAEPGYVWLYMLAGAMMLLPMIFHKCKEL